MAKSIIQSQYYSLAKNSQGVLPVLYEYASRSESIVEMGIKGCISTWALLHGLVNNNAKTKRLDGIDIKWHDYEYPAILARKCGIEMRFIQGDPDTINLPIRDLLFINTLYGNLKQQLLKHHVSTHKWIIINNIDYSCDDEIDLFLTEHKEWNLEKKYNQLTILAR